MLFIFENRFVSDPRTAIQLEDRPEVWTSLLDEPAVVEDDDGKKSASVICGARYFDDASNRDKEGVESIGCLVLDVDCPGEAGAVPTEEALREALDGFRAVVYTSPSHTKENPRWRVLLPLASPLPPKKHRALVQSLSDGLVPGYRGCIDVASTGDPCRLGFVGVTKHPEDYRWFEISGALLDWTQIELEDETWARAPLGGLERSSFWTDRPTALKAALKRFDTTGQGVGRGEGRTMLLWSTSNQLWWEWAAEDEDFVMTVLHHVNANFSEPEAEDEVVRKMTESWQRTISERRKEQVTGPYGWLREPSDTISMAAITHYGKLLRSRRSPEDQAVGEALRSLVKGEGLSSEFEMWRGLAGKCAHQLAKRWPNETAERITDFFRPCMATMRSGGATFTLEEISGWIRTKLEGEKRRRAENSEKVDARMREQIEYVTGGERDTKYTKQEIDGWAQTVGLRPNNWILVTGRAYCVFRNGTWVGPYTKEEFDAQGYKDLAAAADVGVRTQSFSEAKNTWTNIPLAKLVHDYGSVCSPRIDFTCDRSWFRLEDHTLMLAGPVKNDLEAKFHPDVDQWLRVMTGRETPATEKIRREEAGKTRAPHENTDDYDPVCNWLASLPQLEHICAALYLEGSKGVGKGLFADGIAKIWKAGKIPLSAAFGKFNNLLADSALIHVDEGLPPNMDATVLFRRTLAEVEHVYERKNRDAGKIDGCIRLLITANNLDVFNRATKTERLKNDDVDAFGDRFVHVKVRQESSAYLRSLGHRHHEFVTKNLLAEHALWLNEQRWAAIQKQDLRFLVEGRNKNVANVVATNVDVTSDVCNAVAEALAEQRKTDWLVAREGELWVNATQIRRYIVGIQNLGSRYTDREISGAISSISIESRKIRIGKKTLRMRNIRLDALRAWCDNTEVYSWDDVKIGLEKANKEDEINTAAEMSRNKQTQEQEEKAIVN